MARCHAPDSSDTFNRRVRASGTKLANASNGKSSKHDIDSLSSTEPARSSQGFMSDIKQLIMPLSKYGEDVPYISPTFTSRQRCVPHPPPTLPREFAHISFATAPATGVVVSALIPTSRVNHLLVGLILRAIDERRHQVVCPHSSEAWGQRAQVPPIMERRSGFWRCTLFASSLILKLCE